MRRIALAAGLALVGTGLHAARAEDPPAEKPRPGEVLLRLEPGRKIAFSRVVTVRIEHKAGKKKAVSSSECRSDLEIVVGKRNEDGSTALDVRALRTWGFWDQTDEPRIEFDTAREPVDKAGRAWRIVEIAAPGSLSVRPDGRIVEIVALADEQTRVARLSQKDDAFQEFQANWRSSWALADFAASWPALPPKRMGAGTFFETASIPPWAIAPLYSFPLRHELKAMDDDRVILEWTGGVDDIDPVSGGGPSKAKGNQPKPAKVKVSGFGGSAEVDRADGLVRKSHAKFSLARTQTFSVDGNSVEGSAAFEWEATMERVAPAPPGAKPESGAPPAQPKSGDAPK